jgi:hypothetical protein
MTSKPYNPTGPKPEIKWIETGIFVVDHHYQRTITSRRSQKIIDTIAENFLWARFQPPTVMPGPKGKYIIIDGQHRITAAIRRKDIPKIPVYIIPEMSVAEAARNFIAINRDRVNLHPLAAHRALLQMKDKEAMKVQEMCDEAEISIARCPVMNGATAPRETQAIGTIKKGIKLYGEANVIATLMIIPDAYKLARGMMRASIMTALMSFFKARGVKNIKRDVLIRVLKENSPLQMEADAKVIAADEGTSMHLQMCAFLSEQYDGYLKRKAA